MIEATSGVGHLTGTEPSLRTVPNASQVSRDFGKMLSDALHKVNDEQLHAEQLGRQLAAGDIEHMHQLTVAAEKASLNLQLALQVRNKVVEAYTEVMRMQI